MEEFCFSRDHAFSFAPKRRKTCECACNRIHLVRLPFLFWSLLHWQCHEDGFFRYFGKGWCWSWLLSFSFCILSRTFQFRIKVDCLGQRTNISLISVVLAYQYKQDLIAMITSGLKKKVGLLDSMCFATRIIFPSRHLASFLNILKAHDQRKKVLSSFF